MNTRTWIIISTLVVLLTACATVPQIQASYDPAALKFDGEQAYAIETELVTRFPPANQVLPIEVHFSGWEDHQNG